MAERSIDDLPVAPGRPKLNPVGAVFQHPKNNCPANRVFAEIAAMTAPAAGRESGSPPPRTTPTRRRKWATAPVPAHTTQNG